MRFCYLPLLISICLGIGCGNSPTNAAQDSDEVSFVNKRDSSIDDHPVVQMRIYPRDTFMLDSFLVLIDSFFTDYAGNELNVAYRMDSLAQRDTTSRSRRYMYIPVNGSYAKWHYVGGGDGMETLIFEVAECCYPDSISAAKGWKEFKRLAGPDFRTHQANEDDNFPCLSYGNDIAFITGNKIFWLSTYCNWDYDKHNIIATLLKRTIHRCEPIEEIKCKCGDVKPRSN